jgi:alkylation response protein AidB-like acyl-CoA dehydrogenase
MYVDLTPEQAALRDQLRGYFANLMTDKLRDELRQSSGGEGGGPEYRRILKQLASDGWLGIGWPKEYGGQGRSAIEQYIFSEEIQRVGFPLPFLTLGTVGPTIMHYGNDEQRKRFLPPILKGDLHIAIGYSEPEAGTDLASLKTTAVRDGDDWIINGSKVFTSLADYADWIWLAARTDPSAKKHRGISMFMVPTTAPGYKCTPIWTMAGVRTNATYFDNVRVPHANLIGGENNGWSLITGQLNFERVSLVNASSFETTQRDLLEWTRTTKLPDGRRVIDQPWVQQNLARCQAHIEVLKLMNWKQAWASTKGMLHPAEASAAKVFGTEMAVKIYEWMMEVIGEASTIKEGSPAAVLRGRIERMFRAALILTFGGGTNEVQRDIIAMAGLGMPHYKS